MTDASPGRPRRVRPPRPRTAESRRTTSKSGSARRTTTTPRRKPGSSASRTGRTAAQRTAASAKARRPSKGTVHGADYLLLAAGIVLVIAATAMGTWATFAWLFVNLGFDRGTIMPLAILAVLSGVGGVWILVWIQRVPPLRLIGFVLAFAGVGLVFVAAGLALLRRDWGPAVLLGGVTIAAGLGMLLYSAQQTPRRKR
jgi:hypothetical protein